MMDDKLESCCDGCVKIKDKKATIKYKVSEIIYDVNNLAWIEGDIMSDDEGHKKHQLVDITQQGNIDRVKRVLDMAFAEIVEMLYPHTKAEIKEDDLMLDNIPEEVDSYILELHLPSNYSITTLNLLKNYIHEYLVMRVLQDWLLIVYPDKAVKYDAKLEFVNNKIKNTTLSRMMPVRRKLKPF